MAGILLTMPQKLTDWRVLYLLYLMGCSRGSGEGAKHAGIHAIIICRGQREAGKISTLHRDSLGLRFQEPSFNVARRQMAREGEIGRNSFHHGAIKDSVRLG